MSVIQPPQVPGGGWLFRAGWQLYGVGSRFNQLSRDIDDIIIVGKYLSRPFRSIGRTIIDVSNLLIRADRDLATVISWVNDIINGGGFLKLLRWASREFIEIRNSPLGWLLRTVSRVSPYFNLLVFNPNAWLLRAISRISPNLSRFIINPVHVIEQLLGSLRHWLRYFIANPRGFILSQLSQIMPDLHRFLSNPWGYVINILSRQIPMFSILRNNARRWIITHLSQYIPELGSFLNNPDNYLKQKVARYLGLPSNFWVNPFYFLIDKLLDEIRPKLPIFRQKIERVVIDVIMMFI